MPDFLDLLKAIFIPSKLDQNLANDWVRDGDTPFYFRRSSCAIAALTRLRQAYETRVPINFWVPAYFCDGSLFELRQTGANIVFYSVNDDLTPDWDFCNRNANRGIDIFLLVHYFGFPTISSESSNFCKSHKAWLVEDASHVLMAQDGVGQIGDFVFYSPHKHLPLPNGSILIARTSGPSSLVVSKSFKGLLEEITASKNYLYLLDVKKTLIWLTKRLLQKIGVRVFNPTPFDFDDLYQGDPGSFQIGWLSKKLLPILAPRLDGVRHQRIMNANIWVELLRSGGFKFKTQSFSDVGFVPYLQKIDFDNQEEAHKFYDEMQEASIPALTWPDLPREVLVDRVNYLNVIKMRLRQVFLPVHQNIGQREFSFCAPKIFNLAVNGWSVRSILVDEWDRYWEKVERANLVQSFAYGQAKGKSSRWSPKFFLISDADNLPIAIFQALILCIPILGNIVFINQGPLIIKKPDIENHLSSYFLSLTALISVKKLNKWRVLLIAPNLVASDHVSRLLKYLGYRYIPLFPPWESSKLYLNKDEAQLINSLSSSWRGSLRKGVKSGITINRQEINDKFKLWIKGAYSNFQSDKGFIGLPSELLQQLLNQPENDHSWKLNIYTAHMSQDFELENSIGTLVAVESGDTATYLLSMTTDAGRQFQANYVLLWQAILDAKYKKLAYFDLGGLGERTPRGIAGFKKGLNGVRYSLSGTWLSI